ncbi:MAG TPA: hypothetical protein VIN61_12715 [Gammaproteobacteria bacterium]
MWTLVLAFVDIALHRRGPQHLPASGFLFGLVVAVHILIGIVSLQLVVPLSRALVVVLGDTALMLGFLALLLKAFGRDARFLQTATAICGTEALFNALSVPLVATRPEDAAGAPAEGAGALLLLGLFCWSVDVSGYVVSRAIERPYVVGLSIMVAYLLLTLRLEAALFPPAS